MGALYLTHNIWKNKVNVDLGVLISLHVNDGDRYGSFDNTLYTVGVVNIVQERIPIFPRIFSISLLHALFIVVN